MSGGQCLEDSIWSAVSGGQWLEDSVWRAMSSDAPHDPQEIRLWYQVLCVSRVNPCDDRTSC